MKRYITLLAILCLFHNIADAATKCERDYTGGICCWDTNTEGPYKPISC